MEPSHFPKTMTAEGKSKIPFSGWGGGGVRVFFSHMILNTTSNISDSSLQVSYDMHLPKANPILPKLEIEKV